MFRLLQRLRRLPRIITLLEVKLDLETQLLGYQLAEKENRIPPPTVNVVLDDHKTKMAGKYYTMGEDRPEFIEPTQTT